MIVAVPVIKLHTPVPVVASLPANCVVVTLHRSWLPPAKAVVGNASTFIVTSSLELGQVPFAIVHCKVLDAPEVKPVTPLVAELLVVTTAVPAITLQLPMPVTGVLAVNAVELVLQRV